MHTGRPKARVALMLWCLAVSAGAVAACGSTGSGENRLVVNTFGDFGYRELYTRYEQSHPGLKIVERVVSYDDHHKNLQAHLLAGSGTGDESGRRRLHRPVQGLVGQVRGLQGLRRRPEPVAGMEVTAGDRFRREADGAGYRHRRSRDVLSQRPVRKGWPAEQP